jgi:acyl-CoA reductase-like NAD-dependent aldehyde dehydrogenase
MSQHFQTISPIDSSIYVEREYASPLAIQNALAQANEAKELWRAMPLQKRADYCTRAVNALLANRKRIAEEICWQIGRPIRFADGELTGFEERARFMIDAAKEALAPINLPEKEGFTRYIKREPLGIALVLAPWNYPYLTAVNAIIPALMAGNVVILKHSSQTPLAAERFDEAFKEAGLPKGVFQYLHLTHKDTEALVQTKSVQYVTFTGSVAAGKAIERAAASNFLNVSLELGGKDPAYVRADANINLAAEVTIDGAFFNSGQSCCGIERLYVHESIYEPFLAKAVELTKAYILGRPDSPQTTLGPMVNTAAANFVRGQIGEALASGAKAHIDASDFACNEPDTPYLAPQILTHVNHSMRVMHEESFGPVLGIMPVASDEEAISLMNDSPYGLTATVFTRDIDTGVLIGEQLQTGTFFINRCDYLDPALAWTGIKDSGRGCSLSTLGYNALTRPKSFHIKL